MLAEKHLRRAAAGCVAGDDSGNECDELLARLPLYTCCRFSLRIPTLAVVEAQVRKCPFGF
jgi:hypothetical protein